MGQLRVGRKVGKILSVICATMPSKLNCGSTSMERVVLLIGCVHDNTVQGKKNELKKQHHSKLKLNGKSGLAKAVPNASLPTAM